MDLARLNIVTQQVTALDLWLMAVALFLVLALRLLLPRAERRYLRMPLGFLTAHVVVAGIRELTPPGSPLQPSLYVLALFLLLISMGRSAFLLVLHSVVVRRLARPVPRIFRDLVQALVYVGVALITLRAAGVDPGSLLTTSALLTAVIGLSLQDTLGNMFAGLAIQAQRPFETGDWLQFDDNPEHVGRVLEMNWRAVKLLTLDRLEVTVPNAMLAKAAFRNFSKPSAVVRRSAYVVIPYDKPPQRVQALITEAVRGAPGVLKTPPPSVVSFDFTERGVQLWVRFFIDDFSQRDIIDGAVRDRIWYALYREGIEIPAPLRTVRLQEVSDETLEQDRQAQVRDAFDALRHVDFLSPLSDEALHELSAGSRFRLYARGETIIETGESGTLFFVILRGEVEVLAPRGSIEVQVARLGPHDFFGEMSLMTGEVRRATVRTMTEAKVLVIDKYALQPILDASPELLETISRVLAEREAHLGERLADKPEERPASLDQRSGELLQRIRNFFAI
jgi:small-conductance mechanosensitive channel/CRP-like cAMP-binding protein